MLLVGYFRKEAQDAACGALGIQRANGSDPARFSDPTFSAGAANCLPLLKSMLSADQDGLARKELATRLADKRSPPS